MVYVFPFTSRPLKIGSNCSGPHTGSQRYRSYAENTAPQNASSLFSGPARVVITSPPDSTGAGIRGNRIRARDNRRQKAIQLRETEHRVIIAVFHQHLFQPVDFPVNQRTAFSSVSFGNRLIDLNTTFASQ